MFKALKYPIFHQMFIQRSLSPTDLTTYNTNLRVTLCLTFMHNKMSDVVQVPLEMLVRSTNLRNLSYCISYEGSVLSLVTSLGIKDVPKQHVMNNPAIPQKNISHRNSPAPLVRIDIRCLALLFVSEAPR